MNRDEKIQVFSRIEEELKILGRSKKWLAENIGLSAMVVNHWKKRGVPTKHIKKISYHLGVSREWLEGDTQHKGSKPVIVANSDDTKSQIDEEVRKLSRTDATLALTFLTTLNDKR